MKCQKCEEKIWQIPNILTEIPICLKCGRIGIKIVNFGNECASKECEGKIVKVNYGILK